MAGPTTVSSIARIRELRRTTPARVTVEGVLVNVDPAAGTAYLLDPTGSIAVTGICDVVANARHLISGFRLLVPGLEQIAVQEPGATDPFSLPVRTVSTLSGSAAESMFGRRVHIRGVVSLARPDRKLFVHDGSAPCYVEAVTEEPLRTGDVVDVVGFLASADGLILNDAVCKVTGHGQPPPPKPANATAIMRGGLATNWCGWTPCSRAR